MRAAAAHARAYETKAARTVFINLLGLSPGAHRLAPRLSGLINRLPTPPSTGSGARAGRRGLSGDGKTLSGRV